MRKSFKWFLFASLSLSSECAWAGLGRGRLGLWVLYSSSGREQLAEKHACNPASELPISRVSHQVASVNANHASERVSRTNNYGRKPYQCSGLKREEHFITQYWHNSAVLMSSGSVRTGVICSAVSQSHWCWHGGDLWHSQKKKKKKLILRSKRTSYQKDRRSCSIQQSQCMFPGADRDWNRTHLLQPHSSVLQEDRGVNGVLVKLLRSVSPEHIDFTFDIWDLERNLETFSPYGSL